MSQTVSPRMRLMTLTLPSFTPLHRRRRPRRDGGRGGEGPRRRRVASPAAAQGPAPVSRHPRAVLRRSQEARRQPASATAAGPARPKRPASISGAPRGRQGLDVVPAALDIHNHHERSLENRIELMAFYVGNGHFIGCRTCKMKGYIR